ncbi:hypothetical protein SNE40_013095 [Patella caerulea]|uniref:Myb/SANT-like DNA-binding domain-containing protein n=1 Tax=Patella caerulea TaxID=87958 RepID=A0AAN8JIY9_PATCE
MSGHVTNSSDLHEYSPFHEENVESSRLGTRDLLNEMAANEICFKCEACELITDTLGEIQNHSCKAPINGNEKASKAPVQSTSEIEQHFWSESATKAMLSMRLSMNKEFQKARAHSLLWKKVVQAVKKQDPDFEATETQCVNKFKAIKKQYVQCVDHNSKTGNDPITCKFYDEFDEVFGTSDSAKPLFTLANEKREPPAPKKFKCMAKNQGKNNADTEDADTCIELEKDDEGEDVPGRKKRIRGQPTAVLK